MKGNELGFKWRCVLAPDNKIFIYYLPEVQKLFFTDPEKIRFKPADLVKFNFKLSLTKFSRSDFYPWLISTIHLRFWYIPEFF